MSTAKKFIIPQKQFTIKCSHGTMINSGFVIGFNQQCILLALVPLTPHQINWRYSRIGVQVETVIRSLHSRLLQ